MAATVIQTQGLARVFRTYEKESGLLGSLRGFWHRKYTDKIALAPVDLALDKGKIIGLVGANGAGKTTLIKLLSGLIHPSQGSASVLGFTPWERKSDYLRQMSVLLGQKNQLWWDISPQDSFSLLGEIYDLPRNLLGDRVQKLAETLQCSHVLKIQLRRLSLGERMKMEIIGALLHSPRVLFLDEPTIGLDIVAQTSIRNFLLEYVRDEKPTILLTSHYMDDISLLADQLLLLSKGHLVFNGRVEDFVKKTQLLQKISFSLSSPLEKDLVIAHTHLNAGAQEGSIPVAAAEIAQALQQVTALKGVHNLKLEEADFEESIRAFLEAQ
jgi:ABC-2 type transport system ATP-binding protein